jgi:pSer/pThr/pTyr-binding forkhead associated (FHA) protein
MFIKVEVKSREPIIYLIEHKELIIGSLDNQCHLKIDHPSISKKHLKIIEEDGQYFATDQGSTNGSYYKGEQIIPGKKIELKTGMKLRLGLYAFISLVEHADKFERMLKLELSKPKKISYKNLVENRTHVISMEDFRAARVLVQQDKEKNLKEKLVLEAQNKRKNLNRTFKIMFILLVIISIGYVENKYRKEALNNSKKHHAVVKFQSKINENLDLAADAMGYRIDRKLLINREKISEFIDAVGCDDEDLKTYCLGNSPYTGVLKASTGPSIFVLDEIPWMMKAKQVVKDPYISEEVLRKIAFLYILENQTNESPFPSGDVYISFYKTDQNGAKVSTYVGAFNSLYTIDILQKFKKESFSSTVQLNDMLASVGIYFTSY